jgi:hypothetical protein
MPPHAWRNAVDERCPVAAMRRPQVHRKKLWFRRCPATQITPEATDMHLHSPRRRSALIRNVKPNVEDRGFQDPATIRNLPICLRQAAMWDPALRAQSQLRTLEPSPDGLTVQGEKNACSSKQATDPIGKATRLKSKDRG